MTCLSRLAACVLLLSNLPFARATLIAHYPFDEGAGLTASDSAGGDDPGTLFGGAGWGGPLAPGGGFSLSLDSSSATHDAVDLGASNNLASSIAGATLSAWIQPSALPGGGGASSILWIGKDSVQLARLVLQVVDGGDLRVGGREADSDSFQFVRTTNDPVVAGRTYHVAATVDYATNTGILYLDGVEVANGLFAGWGSAVSTPATLSVESRIGSHPDGNEDFFGLIDDVRLYDSVLSPTEIAALMVPEPSSSLLFAMGFLLLLRRR